MMKDFLFAAIAAIAIGTSANAADKPTNVKSADDGLSLKVEAFLNSPVGKEFTPMQVKEAMRRGAAYKAPEGEIGREVLLLETFDKWTEGSEDEPEQEVITGNDQDFVDGIMGLPGWWVHNCQQAGGVCFQAMDYTEDGLTDPGYVRTPPMDISRHPVIRFSAKVRNPNPDNSGFLYYFMTNDTPELSYPYVMNALPISEEWTEVAFDTYAPLEYARIMLYYTAGNILVDDVCIEELIYPLDVVTNMSARVVSGNEIEVSFDPVEGASSYIVSTYSRRYDENVRNTVETSETTVIVPGNYIPDNYITVEVIAKNNTGESYPNNSLGLYFRVDDIDTPEAFDATDVSPNGFTANWKPSNFAVTQQLSLYLTHTVSEEKEELILIDEDFSEIPYSADDNEATISSFNGEPASLDHILNCKGWGFFMGEAIEGSISINNAWEEWGLPGLLTGPVGDYSFAGGKAFVSAKLNSTAEDVVLAVGFGNVKLGLNSLDITMNEGFAEIEISPESSVFDVEISGGDKDSRLMFMITDSREGGDKVIFDNLKITSYPQCGETYTILYDAPLFGHSDNSYKVDVDFTKNDTFEYYTTSSFGNISKESNKIIVYPENSGIGQMQENEAEEIKIYTLDGRRVETCDNLPKGIYIIHQNGKTYKIVR